MAVVQAKRSADLFNSVGVNIHMLWDGAWADKNQLKNTLAATGIKHVRDGVPYAGWSTPDYKTLTDAIPGLKWLLLPDRNDFNNSGGHYTKHFNDLYSLLQTNPTSVSSQDGYNEINNWPLNINGTNTQANLSQGRNVQILYWNERNADSRAVIRNTPIVCLTFGGIDNQTGINALGNLAPYCDYGAWHNYFNSGDHARNNLTAGRNTALAIAPGRPVQITEWGYYTAIFDDSWSPGSGVTYAVQSKLLLAGILTGFDLGIARMYIYELFDNQTDLNAANNIEDSLGIAQGNGTLKPAGVAIRRLLDTVADSAADASTFSPGTLDYTLTGMPSSNAYHTLLQKSNGTYVLAVWHEPDIWNQSTRTEIAISTSNITLTINGKTATNISTIQPHTGVTTSANNTNTQTVGMAGHPVLFTLTGVATTASGPPARINKTCSLA